MTPSHRDDRFRMVILAALFPCVGYIVATIVADRFIEFRSVELSGFLAAAPILLGFISVPSLLPIALAPPGALRQLVTIAMTAVAIAAGVLVVSTDDAQAGLAILLVPYVAVPLALVIGLARLVGGRMRRDPRLRRERIRLRRTPR